MQTQYTFGDTDIAARRLKVLAEVYAASTRAFLDAAVTSTPQYIVDLGCGPGHTTHLLAETLCGDHVLGLDNSEHFIALAGQTRTATVTFGLHDITVVPFPTRAADVLYTRLLLAHLRRPQDVLAAWATQLRPQGRLLLEEVEWIHTNSQLFSTYLEIVTALLAAQSTNMYAGPDLHDMAEPELLHRRSSQVRQVPVQTAQAATMFFLNMQSWKHHPFIRQHYAAKLLDDMEQGLRALIETSSSAVEIEWGMRQLLYERL